MQRLKGSVGFSAELLTQPLTPPPAPVLGQSRSRRKEAELSADLPFSQSLLTSPPAPVLGQSRSRRKEAELSADLPFSQSLLTSAPTNLKHLLSQQKKEEWGLAEGQWGRTMGADSMWKTA